MKLLVNATAIVSGALTGIERYALNLSQELYRIDSDVVIFSSSLIPSVPNAKIPALLAVGSYLLKNREYLLRALWDQSIFRYHVNMTRPDVVLFPNQDGLIFPPYKQIITVHDLHYLHFNKSIPDCSQEIHPVRTKLYRYKMPHILKHSAAVVAVSESTKQDIVSSFNINPDKIHVIYNGYDELRFRVIENLQPTLDRYGLQTGKYFLFVGSILKHKNITRLIQAFAHLEGEDKLVIAGVCKDLEYLDDVLKMAAVSGRLKTRLCYLDYVTDEDLPYLYNGAAAFVLPSLHEGFGVPIIEAMACGTPVITSNCSAMPEVAGDAALLVDPYSVESIAAAMREVLDNPRLVQSLRAAGPERAKLFRWSCSAQKLYDVCKKVSER